MADIYEQHRQAFKRVSGHVLTDDKSNRVATVAFKYPADGAGRLYCYVHFIGLPMQRGYAGGGGYDKASAAFQNAVQKIKPNMNIDLNEKEHKWLKMLRACAKKSDSSHWDNAAMESGFKLLTAI